MYNIIKRLSDVVISFLILFTLSPLLIILALILLITGEHKALYAQERVGYKGRKFRLYKFVTMRQYNFQEENMEFTVENYSRITKLGKFLRVTKINELPQLINVFIGDMTIVGPRPLISETYEMYSEEVKNIIYKTKPGLTGIGSIIFRDEERIVMMAGINIKDFYKKNIMPYKGALELWYYENRTLKIDLIIMFLTALAILFPKQDLHNKILKDLPDGHDQKLLGAQINFRYKPPQKN